MLVPSASISVNVSNTSYTAMMPPGFHTIYVLPSSSHYPDERVSVVVTVYEIGKGVRVLLIVCLCSTCLAKLRSGLTWVEGQISFG